MVANRLDCKYLDYGYTAPREYGMFCVLAPQVAVVTSAYCAICASYEKGKLDVCRLRRSKSKRRK